MDKQILIDDYKQTIERLQKECTEKTDFNIKLMERVKELEEKLNAQFAEMEEKLTAEENKNYELQDKLIIADAKHVDYIIETNEKIIKLRGKLKIAEEFIEFLAGGKCSSDVCKLQSREHKNCLACFENKAQQALQKISEVN